MFGKLVIAPLNIVMYNVFSDHGANLYGKLIHVHSYEVFATMGLKPADLLASAQPAELSI